MPNSKKKNKKRPPLQMVRSTERQSITNLKRKIKFEFTDAYHSILSMSWSGFLFFTFFIYILVNFLFALCYFLCGPAALSALSVNPWNRFLDVFFFSVQTLSTIGYGKITPLSLSSNLLVTFESITGLMGLALITGIMFSRFARPTARVVFSKVAVVNEHDGVESLIFRIGNERLNQIVEARVGVVLIIDETTKEGESYRSLYDLKLERDQTPLFTFTWTVVHPMNSDSPINGYNADDFLAHNAEILVTVSGIDDTFSQTIHSRYSYLPGDILWNHRFIDILKRTDKTFFIDMDNIHTVLPLENESKKT
jgi:inward rectifier potassium channel